MQLNTLLIHSSNLFKIIWKSYQPADFIASQYFRQKKYIGSNERKFISELVFSTLRIKLLADYCFHSSIRDLNFSILNDSNSNIETLCSAYILLSTYNLNQNFDSIEYLKKLNLLKNENFNQLLIDSISLAFNINQNDSEILVNRIKESFLNLDENVNLIINKQSEIKDEDWQIVECRFSIPRWIIQNLIINNSSINSLKESIDLAASMLNSAPVCLRVNLMAGNRDSIIDNLKSISLEPDASKISPCGIILNKRVQLSKNELLEKGIIEVQDIGSQMISYCLAPEKKWKILDACAGAGGKTLHLASLQADSGEIVASDIEYKRLKELLKRAKRFGFQSIKVINFNNSKDIKIFYNYFDAILIDAPCSGTGTLRRMPLPKYRLTPKAINKLADNQYSILNYYSQFLKPGGILIYATCSILGEENDLVIDRFLNSHKNFEPDSIAEALNKIDIVSIDIDKEDFKLYMLPSLHNTDGFFIARLKKVYE